MEIIECSSKPLKKEFSAFRHRLYKGDNNYISTAEFTCEMLLFGTTDFAKSLFTLPLMVKEGGSVVAECILAIDLKSPSTLLISFFEAENGCFLQVNELKRYIKNIAASKNIHRIVYGLNGHLSYGVGYTVRVDSPNSFDSVYTKLYYSQYFSDCTKKEKLYAYSSDLNNLKSYFSGIKLKNKYDIRYIDMKHFEAETEKFRNICDRTIGKTFLYEQTDKKHFYQLLQDMKPFLKPENILFAYDGDEAVGFLFWHPDYNEVLTAGRQNGIPTIAWNYFTKKNRINTVKLNSAGVLDSHRGFATAELLAQMYKLTAGKFTRVETNFVWENNIPSTLLNQKVLKHRCREFEVYIYDI